MDIKAFISFEELCDLYEGCYESLREANESLRNFEGVMGVGIGPKECNGTLFPEHPCFIVYVREKKGLTELDSRALIPKEIFRIKTDVVAVGSRTNAAHNEFDACWLRLSRDNFTSLCTPGGDSYRQAS